MSLQKNPYPLRIDDTVMEKAKVLAKANGRSLNKEIEFILRAAISVYEKENGVISLEREEQ